MAERKFAIRLAVEDSEKVRAALKGMGADGAAGLKQLDDASRKVTPGLKAVDSAAAGIRTQFDSLAGRVPFVGEALKAMGPAGLAAAAGIAAAGFALKAFWDSAQKAREELDRIKTASDNTGISIRGLQALETFGIENDIDDMAGLMVKLEKASAEAAAGTGELYSKLKTLHPEVLKQITAARTQEERWDAVQRAIASTTDRIEKVQIATAAFGKKGAQVIRDLGDQSAAVEDLATKYEKLGLILSDDMVSAVAALDSELDLLDRKQKVRDARFGTAFLPIVKWWSETAGNVQDTMAGITESFQPFNERSAWWLQQETDRLKDFVAKQEKQLADIRANRKEWWGALAGDEGFVAKQIADAQRQLEAIAARLQSLKPAALPDAPAASAVQVYSGPDMHDGMTLPEWLQKQAEDRAAAAKEAAQKAAEALKAELAIEKSAIDLRKELGDWTGAYAQKVAELTPLVGKYGVTQEMVNKALADYRAELDGSAAFRQQLTSIIDAAKTPEERAVDRLAAFAATAAELGQHGPEVAAALRILQQGITDAGDAAEAATPQFQAIEEARKRIADAAKASMSEVELVAAEQERLNALIGSKGKGGVVFTAEEAAKALDAYRDSLHDAKDGMFELRAGAELLSEALDGQIKTIGDVGKVFVKVLKQMLIESLLAQQQLGGTGGSGGGLGGWIGDIFSGVFNSASKTPPIAAGVHHDGRQIGDPSSMRVVSLASYRGARRAHSGFAPDEVPIIAQTGERMLSRMDNATFTRAIAALAAGGGGGGVTVKIIDEVGARVETKERTNADGSREVEVRFRNMARQESLKALASPEGAQVMRSQYAVNRRVS